MNLTLNDLASHSHASDRRKIGSSLADVDPMNIDKSVSAQRALTRSKRSHTLILGLCCLFLQVWFLKFYLSYVLLKILYDFLIDNIVAQFSMKFLSKIGKSFRFIETLALYNCVVLSIKSHLHRMVIWLLFITSGHWSIFFFFRKFRFWSD